MGNVLNVVFGIGIGVVVFVLILLGIQAFYPQMEYTDFCNETSMGVDSFSLYEKCADDITVGECRKTITTKENEINECQKKFEEAMKIYNKNYFIIASIFGAITLLISAFLLNVPNISAGIACAGILTIFVAFVRGWGSTNDKLKFLIGLVLAAVIITLAAFVNSRLKGKRKHF